MPSLEPSAPATPHGGGDALREWFAGQALVGMIPTPPRAPGVLPLTIDGMAVAAYQYTDAMLRARAMGCEALAPGLASDRADRVGRAGAPARPRGRRHGRAGMMPRTRMEPTLAARRMGRRGPGLMHRA